MEGGREQNYWPGFVDALSNVVLTLVFVIVIFVFALVMGANKVAQQMQEVTKAKQQLKVVESEKKDTPQVVQDSIEENKALRQKLAEDEAELQKLRSQASGASAAASSGDKDQGKDTAAINVTNQSQGTQIDVTEKANQKLSTGAIGVQTSENKITLLYPVSVAEMDDKSTAAVVHALEEVKSKFGKHKISINSIAGKEPYSAAQRYAYYRGISVRNLLISKGIATNSDITNHIIQTTTPEDGRVEIIFERQ